MKLVCTQENFKKAIYNTERVIGKQTTLPILENILFETEKGMLRVSATNLEIGVFLRVGAKIEKEGKITIPAKIISNFVNNLPQGENIAIETNDQVLKIKSGNSKASIKGLDAQDFPIIPEFNGDFMFSFSGNDLKENLPKILSCVSLDGTRPELGGVNVVLENKEVALAATDSFRLFEVKCPITIKKEDEFKALLSKTSSIIIPSGTLLEVLRVISQEDQEVEVVVEENQIFFQIDNVRIVSRLINGKYPEYKQIIPREFSTKAIINKEEVLRAVKIGSFFTNSKSGEVNLKIDQKSKDISILAQSEEKGENRTVIKAKIDGPDQEIVFNPRYILDGINAISTPQVAFLANNSSSPVVLRMANEKEGKVEIDEKATYVVMPIKN
jgi:DNA polymerase-3 subunit beta